MQKENEYFQRPFYTDGMLLCANDLKTQQAYDDQKRRLFYRSCIGWGVVYGLTVKADKNTLYIEPGLALGRDGREIYVPQETPIPLEELFFNMQQGVYGLCIYYKQHLHGEAVVLADPPPGAPVPNRVMESFSLAPRPVRTQDDICIGLAHIVRSGKELSLSSLQSPVDAFHPAACLSALAPSPPSLPPDDGRTAWGELRIDLRAPGKDGLYHSGEILPGRGKGDVEVSLTLRGVHKGRDCLISGALQLLDTQIRMAVRAYPDDGTFEAVVQCKESALRYLRILWQARRCSGPPASRYALPDACEVEEKVPVEKIEIVPESAPALLRLEPPILHLRPLEQASLTPVFERGAQGKTPECIYSVSPPNGGRIDAQGRYTAPAQEGFYRISARIKGADDPGVTACVFVRKATG